MKLAILAAIAAALQAQPPIPRYEVHRASSPIVIDGKGDDKAWAAAIVTLGPGELVVVPAGVEHRTAADEEAEILCFEPAGVRNTGDVEDRTFTAPMGVTL